jgi:TRAP-type C4-dicarboxylate transport system permease small subunit
MKILRWLDEHIEEVLLTLLLIGISTIVIAQVAARYVFNSSLSWSDELARYFLIWSTFLSVSYCVKKRISIKIDQFQNSLSKPLIPWVKMLRHTIVLAFCLIMLPFSWEYVMQSVHNGSTSSALQVPMYYIQSASLVGFALLTIRVMQAWYREFRRSWRYMLLTLRRLASQLKEKEGAS